MSKKIFVLAFAALLVVAFAGSSLAATKFTFKGSYMVRSFLDTNPTLNDDDSGDGNYAWIDHEMYLYTKFIVSKRLFLTVDVCTLGENVWGTTISSKIWGGQGDGVPQVGAAAGISAPEVYNVYMNIVTGFGMFRVGRMTGGSAGLILYGHGSGPASYQYRPYDDSQARDRLWYHSLGTFGKQFQIMAVYEKKQEATDWRTATAAGRGTSAQDFDGYFVVLNYKWKTGGINSAFGKYVNNSFNATGGGPFDFKMYMYLVNAALQLNFGGFQFNVEALYLPGKIEFAAAGVDDIDIDHLGYYVDFLYNYGSGMVGLLYCFTPGDDPTTADEIEGLQGIGDQFTPLYYTFSTYANFNLNDITNFSLVVLWWDHTLTENLMMHAAFGWIKKDEEYGPVGLFGAAVNPAIADISDEYGSEFNLGFVYKVMENLEYQVHFAYFIPGDWIKAFKADALGAPNTDGIELESTIQVDNTLTLTF